MSAGPSWSRPYNQRNTSNSDKALKGAKGTTVYKAGKEKGQMENVKEPSAVHPTGQKGSRWIFHLAQRRWKGACCSVSKSCPTLCDPMDCSTPGFPVLHHLPDFAQTHVRWVDNGIQSSHPLSPPSPCTLNFPQHCYWVQAHSAHHVTGQGIWETRGWGKEETLIGDPADQEDGRLVPQNNHLIGVWMPGCFIAQRWREVRKQSKRAINLANIS